MNAGHYLMILGFQPDARPSIKEVKQRWKDLCRKHHPDTGGDPEQFRAITHAYYMLTDAEYRDRELIAERKRGAYNIRGDLDIRVVLPATWDEAFFGREMLVSYNRQHFTPEFQVIKLEQADVVSKKIQIPPGQVGGHSVILNDCGHRCGDVFGKAEVQFMVQPHPKFRVDQHDVHSTEKIPLDLMVKGGKLEVQTMYGIKTGRVHAGSKPGDTLKIKRCGVSQHGSHIVTLDVHFPTKDELRGEAWRGLDIDWSEDVEERDEEADLYNSVFAALGGSTITLSRMKWR